jgi:anti-anti-sigma factor
VSWRTPRTWLRSVLQAPTVDASAPGFSALQDIETGDPSAAIESIAKEQLSLAERLPKYLDDIREESRRTSGPGVRALHDDTIAALKEVERVTHRLSGGDQDQDKARQLDLSQLAERTAVSGRLDSMTSDALEAEVQRQLQAGHPRIVFDLAALEYISSAGLRVLMLAARSVRGKGAVAVAAPVRQVKQILDIAGVSGFAKIYDTAAGGGGDAESLI